MAETDNDSTLNIPLVHSALHDFDPNTAGKDELICLGLSPKQAQTLINYRNSGAVFTEAEDLRSVYGIGTDLQDMLIPYVKIPLQENTGSSSFDKKLSLSNGKEDEKYSMRVVYHSITADSSLKDSVYVPGLSATNDGVAVRPSV